jgi:hypothetical protein
MNDITLFRNIATKNIFRQNINEIKIKIITKKSDFFLSGCPLCTIQYRAETNTAIFYVGNCYLLLCHFKFSQKIISDYFGQKQQSTSILTFPPKTILHFEILANSFNCTSTFHSSYADLK